MGKRINALWAGKLMRTKNFVVLTDTESVIRMDGVDPNSLEDIIKVEAQRASLSMFYDRLAGLIKLHDRILHGPKKRGKS